MMGAIANSLTSQASQAAKAWSLVAPPAGGGGIAPGITSEILFDEIVKAMKELSAGVPGILAESYKGFIPSWLQMQSIQAKLALLEMFPGMKEMFPESFRGFQYGGVVPGPVGRPQLAMVHGGETIFPPNAWRGITIEIPVVLDGREITRVVSRNLGDELRRQGVIV